MTTLTLRNPALAGVAGFRALWDAPVRLTETGHTESFVHGGGAFAVADWARAVALGRPARLAFDAVHRQLLVRFPGLAALVAARYAAGEAVRRAWLCLPYAGVELAPPGDTNFPAPNGYWWRSNWGVLDDWARRPPRWHARVDALRRPWAEPTYNRWAPGCFWDASGAHSNSDRYGTTLSYSWPEVSAANPLGRYDVTRALADATFGATIAARLVNLEAFGFAVSKLETYDHHCYRDEYEWPTATGGRAVLIDEPWMEVEFAAGAAVTLALPPVPVPPASYGSPKAWVMTREQFEAAAGR